MKLYYSKYINNIYKLKDEKENLIGFIQSDNEPKGKVEFKSKDPGYDKLLQLQRNIYRKSFPYLNGNSISYDCFNYTKADIVISDTIQAVDGKVIVVPNGKSQLKIADIFYSDKEVVLEYKEDIIVKPKKPKKEISTEFKEEKTYGMFEKPKEETSENTNNSKEKKRKKTSDVEDLDG